MQCLQCGKEIVEGNFAYVTFGAYLGPADGRVGQPADPLIEFGWHGQVPPKDKDGPGAEMTLAMNFDSAHPRYSGGAFVRGQAEYYYCSTDCLRAWQNGVVDLLEEWRSAERDGRKVRDGGWMNPSV